VRFRYLWIAVRISMDCRLYIYGLPFVYLWIAVRISMDCRLYIYGLPFRHYNKSDSLYA